MTGKRNGPAWKDIPIVTVGVDETGRIAVEEVEALIANERLFLCLRGSQKRVRPSSEAWQTLQEQLAANDGVRCVRRPAALRERTRRPSVQRHFSDALVVESKGSRRVEDQVILDALSDRFCQWRADYQRGHIHILGDESGLSGESSEGVYAFVITRPGCKLPSRPFFHAAEDAKELTALLTAMADEQDAGRLGTVVFVIDSKPSVGPIPGSAALKVADQVIWELVAPLTVELELGRTPRRGKEALHAHIGVEQAGGATAGVHPMLVAHLNDLTRARESAWPAVEFVEVEVLAKAEHGWLAYADALSNSYRRSKGGDAGARALERVLGKAVVVPFREQALRRVLDLLDDWAPERAREFLANLARGLAAADFSDYGVFLDAAIRDAVARLTSPEWRDLCGTLAQVLENEPRRQAGARRILQELTPELIARLPTAKDRAGALNARLHAANQASEVEIGERLIALWKESVAPASTVPGTARDTFVAHHANHLMNRFAFEEAASLVSTYLQERPTASATLTGSLLQCHAFLGEHAAFDELLPRYRAALGLASDTDLRYACYVAHAQLDRGRPQAALEALATGAGVDVHGGHALRLDDPMIVRAVQASPFYRLALLKTAFIMVFMGAAHHREALGLVPDIGQLPNGHPGEGLTFWGALVVGHFHSQKAGRELAEALVERAVAMQEPREIAGVRIAAYWCSLMEAGLLPNGPECAEFTAGVLQRSASSTRSWCERSASRRVGWAARYSARGGVGPLVPLTFSNL